MGTAPARYAERIKWETFARVVALSGLLIFGVAMDLGLGPQPIAQLPEVVLYKLVTGFFVTSFLVLLATYLMPQSKHRVLAWASLVTDVTFAMSLVTISHATESVFLFGLPLAVLAGAALLERPGALVAAAISSVFVIVISLMDAGVLSVDLEPWTVAWLRELGPRELRQSGFDLIVQATVLVTALNGTAILSSQLVIELNRARERTLVEQRELAALRVRYEDVWSSLPDGLATVTQDGVVRTANPALLRILDMAESEVVQSSLGALIPQLDWDPAAPVTTVEIPRFGPTNEVSRSNAEGVEQILLMRGEVLRDADGRTTGETLLVIRDVTKTRQREAEHRNRERLATVGGMAMAIAHEIRNPLASISGAMQMLKVGPSLSEEDKSLMEIAIRETENLSGWLGEFLDYAKPGSSARELVNLSDLVVDTVRSMEQDPLLADGEIVISARVSAKDACILGDKKGLTSLVWNLLRNAVDAVLEVDKRSIEVHLTGDGVHWVLLVADSGKGVPMEERSHLFQPFYTTRVKGTGLGLATVSRVVQAHDGQIEVTDASIGGAAFVVRFPRDRL